MCLAILQSDLMLIFLFGEEVQTMLCVCLQVLILIQWSVHCAEGSVDIVSCVTWMSIGSEVLGL